MSRVLRIVTWGISLVAGTAALALAQDPSQGFVPAADIVKETLPASPLVYTAYAFVWVALIVYVFLLWRRIDRVERELADVTAKLAGRR